jgi:hypothetical protein
MKMIRNQRPGIAGSFRFGKDIAQSIQEPVSIRVVTEYLPSFDSSGDNVVQTTGSIYAGLAVWKRNEMVAVEDG